MATQAFNAALRNLNHEVAKVVKRGKKKYLTKRDARAVYNRYRGLCAFCGRSLGVVGNGEDAVRFMPYIPLRHGGQCERDNILPVCKSCKDTHKPEGRGGADLFDFNSIADVIALLACEVSEAGLSSERGRRLKLMLNEKMRRLAETLQYKAYPEVEVEDLDIPVEGVSDLGTEVAELCEAVSRTVRMVHKAKRYDVTRNEKPTVQGRYS